MSELPEYRPWSLAAVRLLQGVIYLEDTRTWDAVLSHRSQLEEYFGRLGLTLVVDDSEGFAFLRQLEPEELPAEYEALPKLFRRTSLSYGATLLCVLLRDALRRFDEEELENERCVVETSSLLDDWKSFFPVEVDELRRFKELSASLRKLEELKFIRRFRSEPEAWEVRRILKARLPAAQLQQLRDQLLATVNPTSGASRAADGPSDALNSDSDSDSSSASATPSSSSARG
jgi:hypothetical protein